MALKIVRNWFFATRAPWRNRRRRLGLLQAFKWRAYALFRFTFPVRVARKRLAALLLVLNFTLVAMESYSRAPRLMA